MISEKELEDTIDQLKYNFDEGFGRAVAKREEKMLAHTYNPRNAKSKFIAEQFKEHLGLKGFEVEEQTKDDGDIEIWADLTFNYY